MSKKRFSGSEHTKAERDDHSNQFNPGTRAYRARMNNRANQLNPNNDSYWLSRGYVMVDPDESGYDGE